MSTNTAARNRRNGLSIILVLAAVGLIASVLAQWNLSLISGPRSGLITLFILGFVMYASGGLSSKTERDGFSLFSLFVIIGMILGAAAVPPSPISFLHSRL